jgi:phage replication-related protein YjqB (UPF0714/DUF867 family)
VDLKDLLAEPGVEEQCLLRSRVGILALHGGSQDRGTDLIARRAADRAGASYYAIVQPPWLRRHLRSRCHDPADSPALQRFLGHVEVAISVHGFGRDGFVVYIDPDRGLVVEPYGPARQGAQQGPLSAMIVGGLNAELLVQARAVLDGRFEGYRVADGRVRLGFHPDNPVNLPAGRGVQIELPPGLRGIGPYGERPRPDPDDPIIEEVAEALVELAGRAAELITGDPGGAPSRSPGPGP